MKINAHFNFLKGETAEYLKDVLDLELKSFNSVKLKEVKGLQPNQIEFNKYEGFAVYKDGDNEYLMFYYLPKYDVKKNGGFPKYHVVKCDVIKKFKGFVFSNKMPVDVYSKDEGKTYKDEDLSLCQKCSEKIFKDIWGADKPWYDSVLNFVSEQKNPSFKNNGYHTMWNQISEAYREKKNWKCENFDCQIDLSLKEDRVYLHTHHKDGNTKNNHEDNFKALCLLCHGLEHKNKLVNGTGFSEVESFITNFRNKLSTNKLNEFEQLMKS